MPEANPNEQTVDQAALGLVGQVRQKFGVAWEEALRGGPDPDPEEYLQLLPEEARARLRPELEALAERYRHNRAAAGPEDTLASSPQANSGTVDFIVGPGVAVGPRDETPGTVDFRAAPTEGDRPKITMDVAPAQAGGTVDLQPGTPGGTVDFQPADPGGTVDHAASHPPSIPEAGRTYAPGGRRAPVAETVAGYEILGTLGRGAMGVVYKARQRGLRRIVALKMILSGGHASEHDIARFQVEAEAIAQLQHPGIVQIYEVGEEDGRPFFSLEFVDGGSLQKKIAGTPQPPAEAARMAQLLAEAMQCAHAHNIIHRDLKPANVLLTKDGQPKITDFGLAKQLEGESGQTHSGTILGTPSYMAPEQAEGKIHEVGPLSDTYALGAILYELLTGRPPFKAASVLDTLHQVRTQEPVAPTQLQPKVPRDLETICLKCLQKSPAKRYASAGALAEDLRRFQAGEPILARPVGRLERAWRWCRRNPKVAGLSALAVVFVVGWAVSATFLKLEADANARRADENADKAEQRQKLAEANAARAQKNEEKAQANEKKALSNAETSMHRVIALGQFLQNRLRDPALDRLGSPQIGRLRDDLLAKLKQDMMTMSHEIESTKVSAFTRAATYQALGDVLRRVGQGREAMALFVKAYQAAKQVADEQPGNDKAQANVAAMASNVGGLAMELDGDPETAHGYYKTALQVHERLLAEPRSRDYDPRLLRLFIAQDLRELGRAELARGRPSLALADFQRYYNYRLARHKAEAHSVDAYSWLSEAGMWLGSAAWHLDHAKLFDDAMTQALAITDELARHNPQDYSRQGDLADICGPKGDGELHLGRLEAARRSYERALACLETYLAKGQIDDYAARQMYLAVSHERVAAVALLARGPDKAAEHYRQALKLREQMLHVEPDNLSWKAGYLLVLAHSGKHREACQGAEKLRQRVPRSVPLALQVARCFAVAAAAETDLEQKKTRVGKALAALQAAVKAGFRDPFLLRTDPDLGPLRQEPAFRALLAAAAEDSSKQTVLQGS
jgi:predicted Ser/Thr protein kinase